ncbi:MAG: hypothetical protein M3376_05255 [Actinomycetota bacterium]|nr:hypothetical protein [Actinomycetota bacterium]
MPSRQRAPSLLRGLAKLAAVVVAAGGGGVAAGVGLSELKGGDGDLATSGETGPQATVPGSSTTGAAPVTTSTTTATTTTSTTGGEGSLARVRVQILGAVLHPAATPSGRRRQRARIIVRARTQNSGTQPVTLARPALLVGDASFRSGPAAGTSRTQAGELAAGESEAVTLRFELAGEATAQVTAQKRARLVVAGRSRPMPVEIGAPLRPRQQTTTGPTTTQTTTAP